MLYILVFIRLARFHKLIFTFWVQFGYSGDSYVWYLFGMERVIIHVDLNSCFATCEQQDNPQWRGKPLGVVQDSGKRSVIIASSIEAKVLGISTAHLIYEAKKICPNIILVPANFERYVKYAKKFRKVCFNYSDRVEVFSIDELFLDVTKTKHLFGGAGKIALELKRRLKEEVGDYLRCSVGIAPNKMLAKLASGLKKPDGLVRVDPDKRLEFLDKHELWHICGIGHRIEKRLKRMGIYSIKSMRRVPREYLKREFGALGETYWHWAHGEDFSEVAFFDQIDPDKSYGNQVTLSADLVGEKKIMKVLLWLCWQVASRLREKKVAARVVRLALRYGDKWSWAQKTSDPCTTAYDLYRVAKFIYKNKVKWDMPVRFVGVSSGNLIPLSSTPLPLIEEQVKQQKFSKAWDKISQKYGTFYLRPASLLRKGLKETTLNGFSKKF